MERTVSKTGLLCITGRVVAKPTSSFASKEGRWEVGSAIWQRSAVRRPEQGQEFRMFMFGVELFRQKAADLFWVLGR